LFGEYGTGSLFYVIQFFGLHICSFAVQITVLDEDGLEVEDGAGDG